MKKIISIILSILLIASLMTCAAVSTNAATYAEGDIVLYKYVVKCDKIIEAFEGSINYPADDLYVETKNDIAIYDGSTGSIAAHDDGNGQILFNVSSSDDVYDFTKGATLAMVAFIVKNPNFDPASVTINMKNFYDSEHYIKGNIPFSFESFIDDKSVAKGEINLDSPETTATAESSTAATTEPAESSTSATTEPATTAPVESSTAATTEPVESSTAATTEPATTEPVESNIAETTEPAETSTAATTAPVESSTAATTEPVTEAPTTEPQPTVCKHSHTKTTTTAATYFAKGKKTVTCTACGKALRTTSIAKKVLKTPSVTIKGAKKSIKVTLKKKVKDATGFIVKYKEKGKKKVVTKKYKTNKKVTKVIKKLKKNKKYTVQVRAYVQKGKKIAYSKWTKAKNVKTK